MRRQRRPLRWRVMLSPIRLSSEVTEGGENFSSGQRQVVAGWGCVVGGGGGGGGGGGAIRRGGGRSGIADARSTATRPPNCCECEREPGFSRSVH